MTYQVVFVGDGMRFVRPNIVANTISGIIKALRDAQCLPKGKFDVIARNGLLFVCKGDKELFQLTKL